VRDDPLSLWEQHPVRDLLVNPNPYRAQGAAPTGRLPPGGSDWAAPTGMTARSVQPPMTRRSWAREWTLNLRKMARTWVSTVLGEMPRRTATSLSA